MNTLKKIIFLHTAVLCFLYFTFNINACKDSLVYTETTYFDIRALDYSDYHFIPDTLYKSSFVDFMNNTSGTYLQSTYDNQILSSDSTFEIWVQTEDTLQDKRVGVALTMLSEEPAGGYSDTLINTTQIPGVRFFGIFRKLNPDEFYIYSYAGMIGLKIDVPENSRAGITYKTNNGKKYGISSYESNESDTLLLKMFKTENQNPDDAPLAWELKLKNIYRLPVKSIFESGFVLNIFYDSSGVLVKNIPDIFGNPKSLMTITNLDRYTGNTQNPPPDGVFDFLPDLTIDTAEGDIIFPSLRPFHENFINANINTSYYFGELYTQAKGRAQGAANANSYFIIGYFESIHISQ